MKILVGILLDKGLRGMYCDKYGYNERSVNEGIINSNDYVDIDIDFILSYLK